jgi:hydroxymethylbilane synthase
MSKRDIRIGTRKSKLALWQAKTVADKLNKIGYNTSIVPIKSEGDMTLNQPIYSIGIQGVFTRTLDTALLNKKIDIAVHSLKDVPTKLPKGIILKSTIERGNPYDLLLFDDKTKLINVGKIGTGSLRRRAQWLKKYPQDETEVIRGNVQTRLEKLKTSNLKGVILAKAGIDRLGIINLKFEVLKWMIPAPAQGAIGITSLEEDESIKKILSQINCCKTFYCTTLEREFLKILEGGCSAPIGGLARINDDFVDFKGGLFSLTGKDSIVSDYRFSCNEDPVYLGKKIALEFLNKGGKSIIETIKNKL